jgi:hypothetical protein
LGSVGPSIHVAESVTNSKQVNPTIQYVLDLRLYVRMLKLISADIRIICAYVRIICVDIRIICAYVRIICVDIRIIYADVSEPSLVLAHSPIG